MKFGDLKELNSRGHFLSSSENRLGIYADAKYFGIRIDNGNLIEVHDNKIHCIPDAYEEIKVCHFRLDYFVDLLPKREYVIDEIYTILWYIDNKIQMNDISFEVDFEVLYDLLSANN